jgi:hypothetical protein
MGGKDLIHVSRGGLLLLPGQAGRIEGSSAQPYVGAGYGRGRLSGVAVITFHRERTSFHVDYISDDM